MSSLFQYLCLAIKWDNETFHTRSFTHRVIGLVVASQGDLAYIAYPPNALDFYFGRTTSSIIYVLTDLSEVEWSHTLQPDLHAHMMNLHTVSLKQFGPSHVVNQWLKELKTS